MSDSLKNKRLLVIGGTDNEVTLVERAQSLGVYVVVADYNTDWSKSPAKKVADEAWDISYTDLDALEAKCKENHIDGVIAGYSEIRVNYMILLCERLGLPSYCTLEQLDITRDKVKFKNECRKNGVPVVKEYDSVEAVDHYPVIVKPVDRAGSIGISIATNLEELKKAYDYAMEMSLTKEVIIEDFIDDAIKVDIYYEIIDGKVTLVSTDDVINAKNNGFDKVVQSAWLFPSKDEKLFIEKENDKLIQMIQNMGIQNGYIFFSGFLNQHQEFVFFECGFRLCGGHIYNYLELNGYPNNLDLFIYHALNVPYEKKHTPLTDPYKCIAVNFYAKKGTISKIVGVEETLENTNCGFANIRGQIGDVCVDDQAILSKLAMFHFYSKDAEALRSQVEILNQNFDTLDENGNSMVYDYIDPSVLSTWWK